MSKPMNMIKYIFRKYGFVWVLIFGLLLWEAGFSPSGEQVAWWVGGAALGVCVVEGIAAAWRRLTRNPHAVR